MSPSIENPSSPEEQSEDPEKDTGAAERAKDPGPHTSRVQISFDLALGTSIQFTVEALPAQDEAGQADITIEATTPGATSMPASIEVTAGESNLSSRSAAVSVSIPAGGMTGSGATPSTGGIRPGISGKGSIYSQAGSALTGVIMRLRSTLASRAVSLETILFGAAISIYLITHLIGLAQFPIYFFTDEAVQTVLAADLVRDGFHNYDKVLLPTYFMNGNYYNLSTSVYLQVLPYLLFGKSIFVTRLTSVLVSLLAAFSVGLILRDIFKIPYWWSGILLLSVAPSWFLHSRTAFETVIFVSIYAGTIYCYMLYRHRSPRYLYITLVLAALAFYSYSPGQVVMAVTAFLLFLSDLPYHWKNRVFILKGLGLLVLLALPYIRFRMTNSSAPLDHLRNLGSYWIQPLPLREKIARFAYEYGRGMSPSYWFTPNQVDLPRHIMKGYGHLMKLTLPFALIGLFISLWKVRSSAHRTLLIALVAAPMGSALVGVGITRMLVFVIPATLLTALGLSKAMVWLENPARQLQNLSFPKRLEGLAGKIKPLANSKFFASLAKWELSRSLLSTSLLIFLVIVNFYMLRDALVNGPTWFSDYGLGGMQYGASQVFKAVKEYLAKSPDTQVILSPSWSNGTDVVARYFLPDPLPLQLGSIEGHLNQKLPITDDMLFIMIPDEYSKAVNSGKLKDIQVEQTLDYPNGQPGFYFVRARYVDNIDQILEAESEQRRQLLEGELTIDGEAVKILYSYLDMGDISQVFDGDPHTVARTWEANPFIIELTFPETRQLSGLSVIIGSLQAKITAHLYAEPGGPAVTYSTIYQGSVDKPEAFLDFGGTVQVKVLRLEVESVNEKEPAHVHIWEVRLR